MLTVSPWNLINSMKAIDSWGKSINSNINGSTRTGFKETNVTFGGDKVTQVVASPKIASGTQFGEQQLTVSASTLDWSQGEIVQSDSDTHFAIQGDGFFIVQKLTGADLAGFTGSSTIGGTLTGASGARTGQKEAFFTRNGQFHWGTLEGDPNNNVILLDEHGYAVLSDHGDSNNAYGPIGKTDWDNQTVGMFYKIRPSIVQSSVPNDDLTFSRDDSTLFNIDSIYNIFTVVEGADDRFDANGVSLKQGYLESSNVDVDEQIGNLSASDKYYESFTKQFLVYLSNIDASLGLFR